MNERDKLRLYTAVEEAENATIDARNKIYNHIESEKDEETRKKLARCVSDLRNAIDIITDVHLTISNIEA